MALVALLSRQEKHPKTDQEDLATQIGNEIEDLSTMYFERISKNYTLTGEAWGSDQVVMDDFTTCGPIIQMSLDATAEMSNE